MWKKTNNVLSLQSMWKVYVRFWSPLQVPKQLYWRVELWELPQASSHKYYLWLGLHWSRCLGICILGLTPLEMGNCDSFCGYNNTFDIGINFTDLSLLYQLLHKHDDIGLDVLWTWGNRVEEVKAKSNNEYQEHRNWKIFK